MEASKVESIAQGNVADELPLGIFDCVDTPQRLPYSMVAHPHDVVGIGILPFTTEWALAELGHERVLLVVFVAANAHNLLTRCHRKLVSKLVVESQPVGSIEKGVVYVRLVDALTIGECHLISDSRTHDEIEELSLETIGIAKFLAIDAFMLVVATDLQVQAVEANNLSLRLHTRREKRSSSRKNKKKKGAC